MIQVLERSAFEKIQEQKMLVLKNFAKEVCLVLFSGNECQHCDKMKTILEYVAPKFEGKIQFCTINLSDYPELVEASSDTATNITYVPYVLIYVNNIPYTRYEGSYSGEELIKFLNALIQPQRTSTASLAASQAAAAQAAAAQAAAAQRPGTYGMAPRPLAPPTATIQPVLMEKSSFLTFREAYS
jgi:thioredoxin-like negative regulator of GroEL